MASKVITVDKDGMLLLAHFREWLDISKVEFYSLKINKDKTVKIRFYDNKKKFVRFYEQS